MTICWRKWTGPSWKVWKISIIVGEDEIKKLQDENMKLMNKLCEEN